jgi:hypothetical protein
VERLRVRTKKAFREGKERDQWAKKKEGARQESRDPPFFIGTPGGIRTPDLRIRSPALYPAELRAHKEPLHNISLSKVLSLWGE